MVAAGDYRAARHERRPLMRIPGASVSHVSMAGRYLPSNWLCNREIVMFNGKGLAFAAAGAALGALIWGGLVMLTGWNLWFLAPVIGVAAGFGMMCGTQMRGG